MDQDTLISNWRAANTVPRNQEALTRMIQAKRQPVLKRIRRQLIIEVAGFMILLFVYYDFFDGNQKTLSMNLLLAGAILLVIAHNIAGYLLMRQQIKADPVLKSLEDHLSRLKRYAFTAIACRVLMATCLLFFFTGGIVFNAGKYWILCSIIALLLLQLVFLSALWYRRVRQMRDILDGLRGDMNA